MAVHKGPSWTHRQQSKDIYLLDVYSLFSGGLYMRVFIKTILIGLLVALLIGGIYVLIKQYRNIEGMINGSSSSTPNSSEIVRIDIDVANLLHYE